MQFLPHRKHSISIKNVGIGWLMLYREVIDVLFPFHRLFDISFNIELSGGELKRISEEAVVA
jgi:hypothetical protein